MLAGSALYATRSALSSSAASPRMAPDAAYETTASTTAHVSVPWEGIAPARCSSAWNMPLGTPWYKSSFATRTLVEYASVASCERRNHTASDLIACPMFTPCVSMLHGMSGMHAAVCGNASVSNLVRGGAAAAVAA